MTPAGRACAHRSHGLAFPHTMSLSPPAPRKKLHNRSIHLEGFEREDGLFDIEARIVDTKTYAIDHNRRGILEAGTAIHDMAVRLTIDTDKTVRNIEVETFSAPYLPCFEVESAFKRLIGASLVKGWRKSVEAAVGNVDGCTHIKELLGPVATVAFQTTSGGQKLLREVMALPPDQVYKPYFIGKCKGWDESGPAVKELLPIFYVPPGEKKK